MAIPSDPHAPEKKIIVLHDGPLCVQGDIPLVHKTQVVSEYGEPIAWKKDGEIETQGTYYLCRCGESESMPFCDGKHNDIDFDGTESADPRSFEERKTVIPGGTNIVVKHDPHLCCESGYCGNRFTTIDKMVAETADTQVRSHLIAMIERCPAGSYTYALQASEPDIEPDLPQQIAITTEITSDGPINGPIWITGNIPIERSDGQPFETRNRVTLCSCGLSKIKPLCDGTHRAEQVQKIVAKRPADCESTPEELATKADS